MKLDKRTLYPSILFIAIIAGVFLIQYQTSRTPIKKSITESQVKSDDTSQAEWDKDFEVVEIKSGVEHHIQKAYFYSARSGTPTPLIVSLHTWSGDYTQMDELAARCKSKDITYIHPNFRGANVTKATCCSDLVLSDIDKAITYALAHAHVDPDQIYVIGVSGGGYATLSTFMKSKHQIRKFSAWASISDLIAWYDESSIRQNKYADNILACTESENGILNHSIAKQKSPIYWAIPSEKLFDTELMIYAGIYDGIQGSVPITHSINFYNKLLSDLSVTDSGSYVSDKEKLRLLKYRKPLGDYGKIAERSVCLKKEFGNIKLVIFEGNHEMLTEYAFNELLE